VIDASATDTGNGGNVAVGGRTATTNGAIHARGGPKGGDGGTIETSAGGHLAVGGGATACAARRARAGTRLLDPPDLNIDSSAATSISNALNGGTDVTEQTSVASASGFGTLANGTGDINVNAAIGWSTSNTLTLSAYNNVKINAAITLTGAGTLSLASNNAGANAAGGIVVSAPITASGAGQLGFATPGNATGLTFVIGQGSAQFTGGSGAGAGLTIDGAPTPCSTTWPGSRRSPRAIRAGAPTQW
jgi:hypothetical protein